ncbi:hypothetical protein [Bradyrhizobium sp.]|uniref:hypothetical protein n=1 Tax=Bradyrhizobium sp. TaxID=376 RepID=UPI0025C413F2|nr:hypothetical protein [Bradyrhizobium sp.]
MGRSKGVIRRLADETGLDQATIRRALATAAMSEQSCEADFAKAVEIVNANADPARVAGHAANGRGEGSTTTATNTLAEARARAEQMRARKLELENAKAEGKLIDRADVTDTVTAVIASARTACLALGVRCAPKLVGLNDPKQIARTIETEMRRILEDLADDVAFFTQREEDALS